MEAYRRVYDSRHLQADCQEPGSAPEPYARQTSMGYLYLFTDRRVIHRPKATTPINAVFSEQHTYRTDMSEQAISNSLYQQCAIEHSNSIRFYSILATESIFFDSIQFGNLINLPLVNKLGVIFRVCIA